MSQSFAVAHSATDRAEPQNSLFRVLWFRQPLLRIYGSYYVVLVTDQTLGPRDDDTTLPTSSLAHKHQSQVATTGR